MPGAWIRFAKSSIVRFMVVSSSEGSGQSMLTFSSRLKWIQPEVVLYDSTQSIDVFSHFDFATGKIELIVIVLEQGIHPPHLWPVS